MKYFFILLLFPFFGFSQNCTTVLFPNNNTIDSIVYCVTNTTCFDQCDGVISINIYGDPNNEPYSYEWFNNSTPFPGISTQDTLCAGDYIITITDVNGALVDNSHINQLNSPPNFSVFTNSLNDPSCFDYNDGSIDLTINGGTPFDPDGITNSGDEFYTYLWEDGTSTEDRFSLDSGLYILAISDKNGCNRVDSFLLSNPQSVTSSTISDTVSCIGSCDAVAVVIPANGFSPYSYQWSNGDIDSLATNLCFGSYTVDITDANGCLTTNTVEILNPDSLILTNITIDSACYKMCDGQLSVSIEGGQPPYLTEWSFLGNVFNSGDTITSDNLCSGDYQLVFSDANNCSETITIPLYERDSFVIVDFVIDDSCYNSCTGQITVSLLNKYNPPFIYNWSNGVNDTVISNLCPGWDTLEIIDGRGCRDTFAFYVEPADSIYFDSLLVLHNKCFEDENGVISLINMTGGSQPLSYNWSNGQVTTAPGIGNLASGSYSVNIIDALGCSIDSANIIVNAPDLLFATVSSLENVSCNGASDGLIDVDIFGGVEPHFISWNNQIPDTTFIDTLVAGEYIFTVVDSNNCTITDTILIEQPDAISLSDSLVNILCKGDSTGEIHLQISGGTPNYLFSIDGGNSYQSQSYFSNLSDGNYSVIIKDANDCYFNSPLYDITEPTQILTVGLLPPNLSCFGDTGTIVLSVNGGTPNYDILWDNGQMSNNLTGIGAGNYSVTVLDANDCELNETINIDQPSQISVNYTITNLSCFNDSSGAIDLTTSGGVIPYSFLWNNGQTTEDINTLSSSNYQINITDGNNCEFIQQFNVTQPDLLAVSSNITHVKCYGETTGEIDITISGGSSPFLTNWSNNQSNEDLINIPSGLYSVAISDANDCFVSSEYVVNQPEEILSSINTTDLLCNNVSEGIINIEVEGGTPGYTYSIDDGQSYQNSNDFINLSAGNYSVWIKDNNDCLQNKLVTIIEPTGFSTNVNIQNILGCYGDATGSIDFQLSGNTPPYSYQWSNNESTASISSLIAQEYEVVVSDINDCEMIYSYLITQPEQMILTYDVQQASCEEKNDGAIFAAVTGGTSPINFQWGSGENTQNILDLSKGIYSLSVEDASGCILPTEIIEVGFDGLNGCIEIPSGFTPNNDNIHDEWVIYGLNDFTDVIVKVYNRWGQEVFSSVGYNQPWDGKYNGVDLPTAAYYYVIEINESDKIFNGTVTIKR